MNKTMIFKEQNLINSIKIIFKVTIKMTVKNR